MNLVAQNTPTTCGQACLATVMQLTLDEAIAMVGHASITSTDDLLDVLSGFYGRPFYVTWGEPPADCVAIQYHEESGGTRAHWTVSEYGTLRDPANIRGTLWNVTKYIKVD